jgi:HD-GYP domain-containing protein (c-di-GMP phosphodiesterase class II)
MAEKEKILSQQKVDGQITVKKLDHFISLAKPILANSNLLQESTAPITDSDVEVAQKLLQTIAPVDIGNYRLHDHLQLVSKFAVKIGEGLKQLDPQKYANLNLSELEVLGLLHDIGRTFNHRWYRNDLIGKLFLKKIGIKSDLIENFPDWRTSFDKTNSQANVDSFCNDMSLTQQIIEIADFCGKRKNDGGINTFDETMSYHYNSRNNYEAMTNQSAIWPSEKKLNPKLVDFSAEIYKKIYNNFQNLGVNFEAIRQDILK